MNFALHLVAPSPQRIREFALAWTAGRTFESLDEVRAWLGAHRMNLVSELEDGEMFFIAHAINRAAGALRAFEVAREWPHAVTEIPRGDKSDRNRTRRTR